MAVISSTKNLKILEGLPDKAARAAFFAGGRATVGIIEQVENRRIVRRYVGKVRGIVVQTGDQAIFDTREEALANAQKFLADCKAGVGGDSGS